MKEEIEQMGERILALEQNQTAMIALMNSLNERVNLIGQIMESSFQKVETNFQDIVKSLHLIKHELDSHKGNTSESFDSLTIKLQSIHGDIEQIKEFSGHDKQMENLKLIQGGAQ